MTDATTATIIDITDNDRLEPKVMSHPIEGQQTDLLNADAVIALMKSADTPEARELWQNYRKARIQLKRSAYGLTGEKLRSAALLKAMQQAGMNIVPVEA